ncbi:unnamed protein product [Mycena citricolor]|uniref:NAD(P)-binding protein n=1 Tax=Mycena citricolor TaxID=2018698 RepID=A0AAD2JZ43_9AGAR|nr:unnamed protein product [Mycena citricolor]
MGIVLSGFAQSFPSASKFSVDQIPDLSGQVIIVTGANAGVGKETAKALLNHGAKVYMAARSEDKAKAAIEELKASTGKAAIFLQLDLSDLPSIKRAAEEFLSAGRRCSFMFCSTTRVSWYEETHWASALCVQMSLTSHQPISDHNSRNERCHQNPPYEMLTAQGYDLQVGTNVLGHFYFTKLLLPILVSTASATGKAARVVNTASLAAELSGGKLELQSFKEGPVRKRLGSQGMYAQSKLGNVVFSNELARLYGDKGIVSTSMNPGNLRTELLRHTPSIQAKIIDLMLYPASYGALTQLWAGTSEEGATMNGKYLIPWAKYGKIPKGGNDLAAQKALWEWAEEQVAGI